jgi:hypothetical protein
MSTYTRGPLEPESRVTQDLTHAGVRKPKQNLKQARKEIEALEQANHAMRVSTLSQEVYNKGWFGGFFAGLMLGIASAGVLSYLLLVH